MNSTFFVSPLRIVIFLVGYFFLINLQSQFEVAAFVFFASYIFLVAFFFTLLRYLFVCSLKLICCFRGGIKHLLWPALPSLASTRSSLNVAAFNFFSKSFFDL